MAFTRQRCFLNPFLKFVRNEIFGFLQQSPMKYRLTFPEPHRHFIHIEVELAASPNQATVLYLPKWRPGRYEIGPYVQNIADVRAVSQSGKEVLVSKTAFNCWEVAASDEEVKFQYAYYANVADAGSSLFDERQVYINGVNLFAFQKDKIDEPCEVHLELPADYQIACGLRQEGHVLYADDFHQLVDGPLIASANLLHRSFSVSGTTHHVWFQGNVKPDWERIERDFVGFGEAQVELFGGFPVNEYHYLFQIHNKHFYHGVEHYNSTVIALGPGFKVMQPELYEELLGVSCHELFHTWNVKAIRPADMRPYNYDRENYSRLHYITEGVTTYYGDLMLLKGGVWKLEEYLSVFNNSVVRRHYANNGRDHVSLEQASFDSWLVGYKPGVPNRKISFYTKGALAAFILDYLIRKNTDNQRSLDTVMREMYDRFGKTETGYTKEDYKSIAEAHAVISLDDYFEDFICGTVPMEAKLAEACHYFGLGYVRRKFRYRYEQVFGFTVDEDKGVYTIKQVYEGSAADVAGLIPGDELVAVQGLRAANGNLDLLMQHHNEEEIIRMNFFRNEELRKISLDRNVGTTPLRYMLIIDKNASEQQVANRKAWIKVQKPGVEA